MHLRERLRAFQLWFNPKRRRWAGVALIALGVIGMFLNPESRWTLVLGTGSTGSSQPCHPSSAGSVEAVAGSA